ncbi:MAG: hypothetical protein RML47_05025 [Bacteroidota bacterium]|nr:hypothetical protein [Rhodothermia bacterium]MCS7154801.1 hypothetical protein [Bacteroidota bacterium]MDW8137594.1 hypothetical protein [Bacteroidota bacterium]MDW8285452.1 hypothetical protein [Bacteroidota bacterium]
MEEKCREHIAIFEWLSPEERERVRRFVEEHPEWQEEFAIYRRLYRLLRPEAPPEVRDAAELVIPSPARFVNPIPPVRPPLAWIRRAGPWVAAAALWFGMLYGGLWWYGQSSRSAWLRLAEVPSGAVSPALLVLRDSGPGLKDSARTLLAEGIGELQGARRTYWGLFPHFDLRRVERAIALLESVRRERDLSSWEGVEARYFLVKAHLMRRDYASARALLGELLGAEHGRLAEARRLLEGLQALEDAP